MSLLNPLFEHGTRNLTKRSKTLLRDIIVATELSKFNDLVGYTPNPLCPFPPIPWPYPWPVPRPWPLPWPMPIPMPWEPTGNPYGYLAPDQNPSDFPPGILPYVRIIMEGRLFKENVDKDSIELIDVIHRSGVAKEAFKIISKTLNMYQKEISVKMKKLG